MSRDDLSKEVLRRPWQAEDRSVDQLVFKLRHKLPADEGSNTLIQSVHGIGYRLRAPDRAPAYIENARHAEMAA